MPVLMLVLGSTGNQHQPARISRFPRASSDTFRPVRDPEITCPHTLSLTCE